jgi:hypothetical protein
MEPDAIRELARACKREALAEASATGGARSSSKSSRSTTHDSMHSLGRSYSEQEAYEFRIAFQSPDAAQSRRHNRACACTRERFEGCGSDRSR